MKKIKEAEGLIVGGPVYWGAVRSDMMAALQRIAMASMQDGNFLSRKVGGPIAVGRRGGLTSTLQEMLMFFFVNRHDCSRFNLLEYGLRSNTRSSFRRPRGNEDG